MIRLFLGAALALAITGAHADEKLSDAEEVALNAATLTYGTQECGFELSKAGAVYLVALVRPDADAIINGNVILVKIKALAREHGKIKLCNGARNLAGWAFK